MRTSRRALLAALLCGALSLGAGAEPSACPNFATGGDEDGIGGTGLGGDEDGIGGTGLGGDEDGIGGTGIFGVISGLGGVCINGVHVEIGPGTEVLRDGAPAAASTLAVGQVAWLVARGDAGRLVAERIEVRSALRGPLEGTAGGGLRVAGVAVEVPVGLEALGLSPGDPVAVSGLWRDDASVLATRIERLDGPVTPEVIPQPDLARLGRGLARLSVEGFATADGAGPRLLGLALSGAPADLPRAGERIRLVGRPTSGGSLAIDRASRPGSRAAPRDAPAPPAVERPPRPETAPRPVRPDRIERPGTVDRIEPVDRSTSTR